MTVIIKYKNGNVRCEKHDSLFVMLKENKVEYGGTYHDLGIVSYIIVDGECVYCEPYEDCLIKETV